MKLYNNLNDFFFGLNIEHLPYEYKANVSAFLLSALIAMSLIILVKSLFAATHKFKYRFDGKYAIFKEHGNKNYKNNPTYIKLMQRPITFWLVNTLVLMIYNLIPILIMLFLFKIGDNKSIAALNGKIIPFSIIYIIWNLIQAICAGDSYSPEVSLLDIEHKIFKSIIVPLTMWTPAPIAKWRFEKNILKAQKKYISCQEN